ncbi:26S proteasome non-ATPase regulatory subunit 12-like protein [Sarcoptes scabiei]|uniref:26S proteasome non-ATPase regulatory subunit 12-like protein n=1 Tax=Sarcoptes scabiei TaxID=52283 RepID=A0A132AI82_SARSC|nr:26S proteasome non-ATPase regulatory subunit 12-like protein [Sarcoptes scabiei]
MADTLFSDSGKLIKMEVDYSSTVDEKIPICEKLAEEGKINAAIDILLSLEKQTRTGSDTHSTGRVLIAIVKICFKTGNYDLLNEQIVNLTKKRSQIKQAITKMIKECCEYVDEIKNKETQLKYIETLRTVTAGKIYVEVERARLTLKLAHMKEAEGKIDEAAMILQELQVETYGLMEKKEKMEIILEQMRLCLAKKDYIRTQIISKKISTKFFDNPESHELKFKYYSLMIELDGAENNYLSVCKHYMAIYNTPIIKENPQKRNSILKNSVVFIILAAYDNEQSDLINRIQLEKPMHDIPHYLEILKLFTAWELINWSAWESSVLQLLRNGNKTIESEAEPTGVFSFDESGNKKWNDLKQRVVEHNIRVMAKYYSKITLKRMAELLGLTKEQTEEALSALVVSKTVWAKIDRSLGIVNFEMSKNPNEVLNDWSFSIDSLMNLVGKINHLINKEEMIHQNHADMLTV